MPLDLTEVPDFNRQAYAELLKIGYGETTTYGAIARTLGDVAMSRAVGQAMGANPIPLIIPCHRVLGADGKAGGFSSPGGVTRQDAHAGAGARRQPDRPIRVRLLASRGYRNATGENLEETSR